MEVNVNTSQVAQDVTFCNSSSATNSLPDATDACALTQVASVSTSSEPTTPLSESPESDWFVDSSSNPKIYLKLLVSNAAAGSIIGKAGQNINDVQAQTLARIQLSKATELYFGTNERILLVTGRLKQVVAAMYLILLKLQREGVAPLRYVLWACNFIETEYRRTSLAMGLFVLHCSPRSKTAAASPPGASAGEAGGDLAGPQHLLIRLLVPQPLCGVIIGKHGSTIRTCAADSDTTIRLTSTCDGSHAPTLHRIVTISGARQNVLKAMALMVLKQSDDPKFLLYGELPSSVQPGKFGIIDPAFSGCHGPLQCFPASSPDAAVFGSMPAFNLHPGMMISGMPRASLGIILTGEQAGVLLEQGNGPFMEIEQTTGCHVQLEMVDGPHGLVLGKLLLSGSPDGCTYAQFLIGQRLAAAASFQIDGTTYFSTAGMAMQPRLRQPEHTFNPGCPFMCMH
ncbi:hypothetical protein ACK3TF_003042 [Chlorella vulgaris]